MGGSHKHSGAVGARVVDAVGDGDAIGLRAEVVVVDQVGSSAPGAAGVLEVADQLALLGINTDDRQVPFSELDALLGDVGELLVAVGAGAMSDAFVVDAEPDLDIEGSELL